MAGVEGSEATSVEIPEVFDCWDGLGVGFCDELVVELLADFCALILALRLAVYWLVLCTCLGALVLREVVVGAVELFRSSLALTSSLEPPPLGVELPLEVVFVYLFAARLALVVVYCRWMVSTFSVEVDMLLGRLLALLLVLLD